MRRLRVLAACEMSGRVRDAFAARGWESWSADLLPSERPSYVTVWPDGQAVTDADATENGNHYQGDVRDLFKWNHLVNHARLWESMGKGMHYALNEAVLWDLVIAFPPCFTAGTPVITARGIIPVEEVTVGDRVLTHKGRWRTVTDRMSREAPVVTDGQITATPDHPFWARGKLPVAYGPSRRGGGGKTLPFELAPAGWAHASETQGAYLAIPAVAEPLSVPVPAGIADTNAFWYAVGRWLGDGWTRIAGDKHYDTIICCAHDEAADLEAELAESGLAWRRSEERTVVRFTLSNRHLCGWLEENFGKYAYGKTIPGWLFGAHTRVRDCVLFGYLDADGSRSASASPSLIRSASTVSRELAVGIRVLATTLGYTTTLTRNRRAGSAVIEGRAVTQRDSWTVVIRKDDGRFTRTDGVHRWVKQRRQWADAGVQTVYDLTVEEDHSFIAHGFAVHNCTHLSVAGAVHWKAKRADGRQDEAAAFFMAMTRAPARHVAVENPRGDMTRRWRPPDQYVQPWWFGDPLVKATGLWLRGLPLLVPDDPVEPSGRVATGGGSWRTDQRLGRGANNGHEDGEGRAMRQVVRNRTLPGLARAMASQWGAHVERGEAGA